MTDKNCSTCRLKPAGSDSCDRLRLCKDSLNKQYTLWEFDPLRKKPLEDPEMKEILPGIKHKTTISGPGKIVSCPNLEELDWSTRGIAIKKLDNPFEKQVGGNHYKKPGVPDVTEWCMLHGIDLAEFNVIKYTFRHEKKNGIEDLRKAQHYLEFIAWIKYGENL